MWFEELMEDCKQALALTWKNPGVLLPWVVQTLLFVVLGGVLAVALGISVVVSIVRSPEPGYILQTLAPMLLAIPFVILAVSLLNAFFDAGGINLLHSVVQGERATAKAFWSGAKTYFLSIWGVRLLIAVVMLILSPLLLVLGLLWSGTVGILTGGWGITIIGVIWAVFFSAWPIILIEEGGGGLRALRTGFRLGRHYFWGMFVLGLGALMLGQHFSSAFGVLLTVIIGWIIAIAVRVWFRLTLFLVYSRHREEIQ